MYPINGYIQTDHDGKRRFCASPVDYSSTNSEFQAIPCGKCFNCLMNKRMDWTVRLFHESLYHKYTYFVTLTYADDFIEDNKLNKRHCQLFFKRLRKKLSFRYFLCGEYGETTGRRHYHLIMYTDIPLLSEDNFMYMHHNVKHYRSPLIAGAWQLGIVDICEANISSMRYVCGYVLKKLGKGTLSDEFILTSRNPGIASRYISEHWQTAVRNGFCTIQGKRYSLPKYYWDYVKLTYPEEYAKIIANKAPRQAYGSVALSSVRAIASKVKEYERQLGLSSINNKL